LLRQFNTIKIVFVGTKEETNLCNCKIELEFELHRNPVL